MSIVIPAIKGKMGTTEYFESKMGARELVTGVRPAQDLDEWASMRIDERLQRELDERRVKREISPYVADNPDRFFGSLIVLVYEGEVHYESIEDLVAKIPMAYRSLSEDIGFVTIDGGSLIVLDGQHRWKAIQQVIQGDVQGKYSLDVPNDELPVIFVKHESARKTRSIFNRLNRYAKKTGRGDDIITSEDDGYAIVTRQLLDEGAPFGVVDPSDDHKRDVIVNWKSNTLSARSTKLTTISAIYDSVKLVLNSDGVTKIDPKNRPEVEELSEYYERAERFWKTVLDGLRPYREALADPKRIPKMREDEAPYSLLFKPAAQTALADGLLRATDTGLSLEEAVERADRIPWSMKADLWRGIMIRPNGTIDVRGEARTGAAQLISYLIAADKMTDEQIDAVYKAYNREKGYDVDQPALMEQQGREPQPLPEPVAAMA